MSILGNPFCAVTQRQSGETMTYAREWAARVGLEPMTHWQEVVRSTD